MVGFEHLVKIFDVLGVDGGGGSTMNKRTLIWAFPLQQLKTGKRSIRSHKYEYLGVVDSGSNDRVLSGFASVGGSAWVPKRGKSP